MRPRPRREPNLCLESCLELLRVSGPPTAAGTLDRLLREVAAGDLLRFLGRHRVDQLWYRAVLDRGWDRRLPPELDEALKRARRHSAARVLLQLETARRAAAALDGEGVGHVFFKGIQLGEELYGDAVLRPAADVDLLVAEDDRRQALAALAAAGFSPAPEEGQPPYQITLAGHGSALDLHWHLLAPARRRESLAAFFLASRRRRDGLWFPDAESTLAALLLLPAVSDHVTSRLIHAVDLDRWLRRHDPGAGGRELDGRRVFELLARSGLKTAAWTMLEHTRRLFDTPVPPDLDGLAPGGLRRRYLRAWLRRDPARLHRSHPLLVRGGFSLFLHDRSGDAVRAIFGFLAVRGRRPGVAGPGGRWCGRCRSRRRSAPSPPPAGRG